jgi:hypothetical protein
LVRTQHHPPLRKCRFAGASGSSVAAVGIGLSRAEQTIGAEQSRFFSLNKRNLLTG